MDLSGHIIVDVIKLTKVALTRTDVRHVIYVELMYSKTCLKRPLSKGPKIRFQDQSSLNAGHKHCRMLQRGHSAIRSTFIKLPFATDILVLSIFEWPLKTRFTVYVLC